MVALRCTTAWKTKPFDVMVYADKLGVDISLLAGLSFLANIVANHHYSEMSALCIQYWTSILNVGL